MNYRRIGDILPHKVLFRKYADAFKTSKDVFIALREF
jgi:hypothetical protein